MAAAVLVVKIRILCREVAFAYEKVDYQSRLEDHH